MVACRVQRRVLTDHQPTMVKRGINFGSDLCFVDEVAVSFKPVDLVREFLFLCGVLPCTVGSMKSATAPVVTVDVFIVDKVADPAQCVACFGDDRVSLRRTVQTGQCRVAGFDFAAHLSTVS